MRCAPTRRSFRSARFGRTELKGLFQYITTTSLFRCQGAAPADRAVHQGGAGADARPPRGPLPRCPAGGALARMRELTELKRTGGLLDVLLADYGLFHLEGDLRWIEMTAAWPEARALRR